jgi:hypothetical protein
MADKKEFSNTKSTVKVEIGIVTDIPNPPVPSLLVLNIAMPLFCSVLVVTMLPRNDNVTLILLVLQLGLRIGPIQRMGAN